MFWVDNTDNDSCDSDIGFLSMFSVDNTDSDSCDSDGNEGNISEDKGKSQSDDEDR